jgi:DNA topoisomerase VI subunit A
VHKTVRQEAPLRIVIEIVMTRDFSRDIYYRDVALFGTQDVVDRVIEDLAATLGIARTELGVVRRFVAQSDTLRTDVRFLGRTP